MTGSAFLPWGEIEPEKLLVTRGKDFLLIDGDPDGHHAARCRECFSLLYWTGYEGKIRGPYGSLLDAPSLKPMGCCHAEPLRKPRSKTGQLVGHLISSVTLMMIGRTSGKRPPCNGQTEFAKGAPRCWSAPLSHDLGRGP